MPKFSLNQLDDDERRYRALLAGVSLLVGMALISALTVALPFPLPDPPEGADVPAPFPWSAALLGRGSDSFTYPFTIQNVMWLMFCFALGELWTRFNRATQEMGQLGDSPLPWNDESALFRRGQDLARVYGWTRGNPATRNHMLQRVTRRVVQQFQLSGSVDQASNVMESSMELMQHEVDLKYNLLRYLVWLIPTLGFIGTVVGIAFALQAAGDMPTNLQDAAEVRGWFNDMTVELGVAFYTTLLALLMAAVLVFLMHVAQEREEAALNTVGQCCLDHLVNRLVGDES